MKVTEKMQRMLWDCIEAGANARAPESHVFVVHPATAHVIFQEGAAWLKRQPPDGELVLCHVCVGHYQDIPILISERAPEGQVYLLGREELSERLRRGLVL